MSSNNKAPVLALPDGITDPYKELEIAVGADDTEIKKAYRALSRIHHPDKHVMKSDDEKAKTEAKFLKVKAAYNFLCDTIQKKLYDEDIVKKQNAVKRREERDGAMDAKRRAMKKQLDEEENRAKSGGSSSGSSSFKSPTGGGGSMPPPPPGQNSSRKANSASKEVLDKMRRENRARMEAHGNETEQRTSDAVSVAAEIRDQRNALGVRSVSIKWKRKVHNFSEEDILTLLKPYGDIESVNFVGSKGNGAIVLFINADDAAAAAAYASTDSIRIDVVGAKSAMWASPATPVHASSSSRAAASTPSSRSSRDTESLDEFNAKRALERERLMKKLADEEAGIMHDEGEEEDQPDRARVRLEHKLDKHADNNTTNSTTTKVLPDESFFSQFMPIKTMTPQQLFEKEKRVFEFLGCDDMAE
jgi:curved DNA-binding protein CbpA